MSPPSIKYTSEYESLNTVDAATARHTSTTASEAKSPMLSVNRDAPLNAQQNNSSSVEPPLPELAVQHARRNTSPTTSTSTSHNAIYVNQQSSCCLGADLAPPGERVSTVSDTADTYDIAADVMPPTPHRDVSDDDDVKQRNDQRRAR